MKLIGSPICARCGNGRPAAKGLALFTLFSGGNAMLMKQQNPQQQPSRVPKPAVSKQLIHQTGEKPESFEVSIAAGVIKNMAMKNNKVLRNYLFQAAVFITALL